MWKKGYLVWCLVSMVGVLIFRGTAFGESNIQIKEFSSQKVLYDFNEDVKLYGVVVNNDESTQNLKVEVWIKKGVDKKFRIDKGSLTLPANMEKKLSFSWNPGKNEYGYAAYLILKTKKREVVATSSPAVFEVCHDWRKVCRMGSILTYGGWFDPDYPSKRLEGMVNHYRSLYLNNMEFFGDWSQALDNLTPEIEVWPFWRHADKKKAIRISKAKTKEWIKKCHQAGIKVIGYYHVPRYPVPDESWKVYDLSGKCIIGGTRKRRERTPLANGLKFADAFSRELSASIKEYDWDGYFLDGSAVMGKVGSGFDKEGNPLTKLTAGEAYARCIQILTERTDRVKDNFVIVPNGLHHVLYGIELTPSRDMFGKNLEKFRDKEAARYTDVWFYEGQSIKRRANTPWQIGRSLRAVREATGVPVWAIFFIAKDKDKRRCKIEAVKPLSALILSNGIAYWDHFGGRQLPSPKKDEVSAAIASYLKFACRYGQYLYDLDIHWTPKGMVKVEAPNHVYWKGNSFQRQFKDYQEVYVHLLNFDKPYLQAKLQDDKHQVPEKVENIKIEIALPSGYRRARAYNLNADGDQEPEELKVTVKKGKAELTIPSLEYWNLVVVKLER